MFRDMVPGGHSVDVCEIRGMIRNQCVVGADKPH